VAFVRLLCSGPRRLTQSLGSRPDAAAADDETIIIRDGVGRGRCPLGCCCCTARCGDDPSSRRSLAASARPTAASGGGSSRPLRPGRRSVGEGHPRPGVGLLAAKQTSDRKSAAQRIAGRATATGSVSECCRRRQPSSAGSQRPTRPGLRHSSRVDWTVRERDNE